MPQLDHLFACIVKGDLNRLVQYFKKNPSLINAAEEEGISLLHYAVLQDRPEIVIYLSNNHDCHLTPQDKNYGHTPLHVACLHDNLRMAQHLLTKLSVSEINAQDQFGWTSLHLAARNGNFDICTVLVKHRAKVDIKNKLGKTPLHYAAQHGFLEVLKLLYETVTLSSVTPSATEVFTLPVLTLLHLSALNNHQAVIDWLQHKLYPPNVKCLRFVHQKGEMTLEEYPEETAFARGHVNLKATLQLYRQHYESWINDISSDHTPLGHVRLVLCGPPNGGKTSLRESLERNLLQQLLLLGDIAVEGEAKKKNHTYGINITDFDISGNETFHVWDLSGDIESFITHHFFLTTNCSIYVVVIDLSKPISETRHALSQWLGCIKMHNLGKAQVYENRQNQDIIKLLPKQQSVPLPTRSRTLSLPSSARLRSRLSSAGSTLIRLPRSSTSPRSPSPSAPSPITPEEQRSQVYSLTTVPVIVVGSHLDLISENQRSEVIGQVESCINDFSVMFRSSLEIIPQVFPINCVKPSTSELKYLKEQISIVQSAGGENELLYPKIFDKVIKKIESIKLQSPDGKLGKVMKFDEFIKIIHSSVNQLITERQLSYILKCLSQTGLIIYFEQGALSQWVFIDPSFLCQDILGHALSPSTYPVSPLTQFNSHILTEEQIVSSLSVCDSRYYAHLVPELLQHFVVCNRLKSVDCSTPTGATGTIQYQFPIFNTDEMGSDTWCRGDEYIAYIGRRLTCTEHSDFLPPGFLPMLQVQLCILSGPCESFTIYTNGILCVSTSYQYLIKVTANNCSIDLIGRLTDAKFAGICIHTLDHAQNVVTKISRLLCPSVFFERVIFSARDLKEHSFAPYTYPISDVVEAMRTNTHLYNEVSKCTESVDSLLFFGDKRSKDKYTGRGSNVAFLHTDIFEKLELLLGSEDCEKGWKDLAKNINLSEYIEILKDQKEPVKKLIMKWGEKPRWTVDNLLYALQEINRIDAYNLVRARTDKKYEQ